MIDAATASVVLHGPAQEPVESPLLDVGSGEPMLCLAGLVGTNRHWHEVIERLHERFRCLALEVPLLTLRGKDCSVDGVSVLVRRFIEDHIGRAPLIVGSSFGGHVGLKLAIRHPTLVRGLVLAGSSGLAEKPLLHAERPKHSREWIEAKISELFFDVSQMRQDDVERAYLELSDRRKQRALIRLSRSARSDHLGDQLGRIVAPTLVLWGREDVVTPPEAAIGFASAVPDAELVWLDRCGHAPMMECPDRFTDALDGFASRVLLGEDSSGLSEPHGSDGDGTESADGSGPGCGAC